MERLLHGPGLGTAQEWDVCLHLSISAFSMKWYYEDFVMNYMAEDAPLFRLDKYYTGFESLGKWKSIAYVIICERLSSRPCCPKPTQCIIKKRA